eukprot:Skav236327  [mRNA]  locus=scaffold97:208581:210623:- [translate_table: standard]
MVDYSKWDKLQISVLLRPIENEPVTLVDCGSGSTRALFFKDDGLSQDGSLAHERLDRFRDRLDDIFGPRARFLVLSGEEEARAEWEALQHALDFAPDLQQDTFHGMLSGGGMSCQLARRGGGSTPELFSFRNDVLQPGGLADKARSQKITGQDLAHELAKVHLITERLVADLPQEMMGNFALVEWLGLYVAGESTDRDLVMGLGYNRWLSHEQVSAAVSQHLAQLHQEHFGDLAQPISRRSAISWVYGIILQNLLRVCFDPKAQFYCLKGINWSTGHYLMHKETMEESSESPKELLLATS